jgi:hypothetical protein
VQEFTDWVEVIEPAPVSLMPEDLLKGLRPQDLRDLFSYLESEREPAPTGGNPP